MSFKHELFPTPIWGFKLSDTDYLKQLEVTLLEMSKVLPNRDKSNFLGWQSPDDIHKYEWLDYIKNAILRVANTEIKEQFSDYCYEDFYFESMWANINYPNAFNMAHIHGAELSGVFYVKVPAGKAGRIVFVDPRQRVSMSEKKIRCLNYPITPEEGVCIIFPSWLEHYVEPNETNETRISMSFNLR